MQVSQSSTVSYVIEELVQFADRHQLTQLLERFSTDWETVCSDQFASHVIQAVVKRCASFLRKAASLHYCILLLFLSFINTYMFLYIYYCIFYEH